MLPQTAVDSRNTEDWKRTLWPTLKAAWLHPAPLFLLTLVLALGAWTLHRLL